MTTISSHQLQKQNIITGRNTIEIVNEFVDRALLDHASDIHIEALGSRTVVRFRIDGMLHNVFSLPRELHPEVIARFKILANLKIDESRRPQDGRIELENPPNISLRVSIMPTLYGEKVAIRILRDSYEQFAIENLGLSKPHKETILRNIEKPFGMVITSGPTGSGKTTTLYGMLSAARNDSINVSTLEDPIEYALPGVNQIQVNPRVDLTFASGLRSLLRQDPDVIMVGEIRDSETAVMAANAALTGHLVLTTIHTNNAPSVFPRLLEMNVEDFIVGSVVNLVVGQRLVRKICISCMEEKKLDATLMKKIKERKDVLDVLELLGKDVTSLSGHKFKIGKGCNTCLNTGYSGRVGIFEVLELNKNIHDEILAHASAGRVKEIAEESSGFHDLISDGLEKVFSGVTTFSEILRTTRHS